MSYISEVTADLVSEWWWPLNDTSGSIATATRDFANGSYVGAVTLGPAGLIGTGSAVETTAGSYVKIPTPGWLGTALSIEFWFEYVSGSAPLFRDNKATGGWFFDISGTNPVASINSITHTVSAITSASLKDSARHHFVLTSDSAHVWLYIDGTLVETWGTGTATSSTGSSDEWAYSVLLGKDGLNSNYTDARYAALVFYDRVLPADRVAAHFAAADEHEGGTAMVAATGQPGSSRVPGTAKLTATANQGIISQPVVTTAFLALDSSTTEVDEPLADPNLDAPHIKIAPLHIVAPSVPTPTLVDGRPT